MVNVELLELLPYLMAFLSFLLLIRYRKKISLWFIGWKYGKFSYKYLSKFFRFYYELPFTQAIRYEPMFYIQPFFENKDKPSTPVDKAIDFDGFVPGEIYIDFFKHKGKPKYLSISDPDSDDYKFVVAGYSQHLHNYMCIKLYFFHNNILVLGQYLFKKEKQKVDEAALSESFQKIFLNGQTQKDKLEFNFIDGDRNKMDFYDNGFSIAVSVYNTELQNVAELIQTSIHKNNSLASELAGKAASVTL